MISKNLPCFERANDSHVTAHAPTPPFSYLVKHIVTMLYYP